MKKRTKTTLILALVVVGIAVAAAFFLSRKEGFQQRYNLPLYTYNAAEYQKRIDELKTLMAKKRASDSTMRRKIPKSGANVDPRWAAGIQKAQQINADIAKDVENKRTALNNDIAKVKKAIEKGIADVRSNNISPKQVSVYKAQQNILDKWVNGQKQFNALVVP